MIGKIQRIKSAANADIGAFLRALYDYDIPRLGDLWKMGSVSGNGGDSLTIWPDGGWKDFATGQSGDLIDLAQLAWDCTKDTLYHRLEQMLGLEPDFKKPHPVDREDDSLEAVEIDRLMSELSYKNDDFFASVGKQETVQKIPEQVATHLPAHKEAVKVAPDELPPWKPAPEQDPWTTGALKGPAKSPSMVWPYHNKEGQIVFWVGRFERPSGKVFSVSYFSEQGWVSKKPRLESYPLLDIHLFWRLKDSDPDTTVVLVEGEKAATIGNSLGLPGFWFTTWHGGASGTKKQDFLALADRRIILWPDNDAPGKEAMHGIFSVLNGKSLMTVAELPTDWALKDDVADINDRFGAEYIHSFLIGCATKIPESLEQDLPEEHREPNQLGSVYRLLDRYGKNMRFSVERNAFMIYRNGYWQLDVGSSEIFGYVKETVERVWQDCVANDPKLVEQYARASKGITHMKGIMEGAQMMPEVAVSENDFDPSPDHLCVRNGYLDLRTGELRPHTRDQMSSKMIPFDYDPNAEAPRFKEFMHQIMCGDAEMTQFLQDYFGYSLTGNPPNRIFPIFFGGGQNGKSTLINIVSAVMGEYHVAARTETIMASDRPDKIGEDVIPLRGARLATLQESEKGMKINESKIKGLTGRDKLRCRYLHSNTWLEWVNTAKLVLATNYRPKISGSDRGIWDRIALVPFNYRVPKGSDDADLHVKILSTEGSGVLKWMVDGARRYYQNDKKIYRPNSVIAQTKVYQEDENTVGSFVDQCLAFSPTYRIEASKLYLLYKDWMETSGDEAIKSTRTFREEITPFLEDLQVKRRRISSGWIYEGVGRRSDYIVGKGLNANIDTDIAY